MSEKITVKKQKEIKIKTIPKIKEEQIKQEQFSVSNEQKENDQNKSDSDTLSSGFITLHAFVLVLIALILLFNQFQIGSVQAAIGTSSAISTVGNFVTGKSLSAAGDTVIGPQLQADGKTTKLVEWPTISSYDRLAKTGDAIQDAMNYVVPSGVPFYATEGSGATLLQGVSFDDPITSQKVFAGLTGSNRFGTANLIELSSEEEQRYDKLTGIFTCDYCCGGPTQVTIINRCGCAHAYAWKGMTRFFIKYYGDTYSDEQILGEMTKWKALWYPKGMVGDYLLYTGQSSSESPHGGSTGHQDGSSSGSSSISDLENLPGMVGGC